MMKMRRCVSVTVPVSEVRRNAQIAEILLECD